MTTMALTEAQRRVIAEQVARMFMPDSIQQEATDNILYEWGRGYRSPAILACVAAEAAMLAVLNGEPEARPSESEDEKTTSQLYQEWQQSVKEAEASKTRYSESLNRWKTWTP